MNPVNQSVSAGMWGFILFFVLAPVSYTHLRAHET